MIKLKLKYFNGTEEVETITPTMFNDNTSQVWKIGILANNYKSVLESQIIWIYENESELLHVAQLSDLVNSYTGHPRPLHTLFMPFLPYARQDKPISNKTTFAERTFSKFINTLKFDRVISFDVHGVTTIENLHKISSESIIKKIFEDGQYEVYCYPDGGACERYVLEPSVHGAKYRNPYTGEIEDYQLITEYRDKKTDKTHGVNIAGKKILIVDDLCDQGGTFVALMELLKNHKPGDIGLYISHMVGDSPIEQKLHDAGITNIYYTNSLIKNEEKGIKIV